MSMILLDKTEDSMLHRLLGPGNIPSCKGMGTYENQRKKSTNMNKKSNRKSVSQKPPTLTSSSRSRARTKINKCIKIHKNSMLKLTLYAPSLESILEEDEGRKPVQKYPLSPPISPPNSKVFAHQYHSRKEANKENNELRTPPNTHKKTNILDRTKGRRIRLLDNGIAACRVLSDINTNIMNTQTNMKPRPPRKKNTRQLICEDKNEILFQHLYFEDLRLLTTSELQIECSRVQATIETDRMVLLNTLKVLVDKEKMNV